ncbi:MAG: hypothetical protein OXM61_17275 [Candidatus Poribacteria bacterium]|nr:hypothetical protein [Candidatus Poribacteria bacterium]
MRRDWSNTYEEHQIIAVVIDHSINTLPQLNEDIVEEYRQAIRDYGEDDWQEEWLEFPKITADKHLWSGFHTIEAVKREFGEQYRVEFEVEGKTRDDALLLATKENGKRGRRRTNEEKRIAVLRWLTHKKGKIWANSHIATQCNVSAQLVGEIVKNLTINNDSEIYDPKYKRPSKLKYINKYGKQATMETKSIGNNADSGRGLDTDTRQRYIDDYVELMLREAHIPWALLTNAKDDDIHKLGISKATEHEILSQLGIKSKYNISELEINDFIEAAHTAAVTSVRKMRADLFKKSEAMWQRTLDADFYQFDNYTQLIENLGYYRNNEDERDEVFAVLSQTPVENPDKILKGFPVSRFRHWMDMISHWNRNLTSMFEPNEQGCEWFLSRKLYDDGILRELDIKETAAEYNLTEDRVRALIVQVELDAQQEMIEIIHNRFESITEDTEYIAKGFKKIKASGNTQALEAAADAILENAKVVDKVTELIQSVQEFVASMDKQQGQENDGTDT